MLQIPLAALSGQHAAAPIDVQLEATSTCLDADTGCVVLNLRVNIGRAAAVPLLQQSNSGQWSAQVGDFARAGSAGTCEPKSGTPDAGQAAVPMRVASGPKAARKRP